ncbi:MAG: hypothetical protein E6Q83_11715 [Thiothrix sp.]|nr:MAG: hypothetical protein E6Q83_11715 [Thiothrix sp.]
MGDSILANLSFKKGFFMFVLLRDYAQGTLDFNIIKKANESYREYLIKNREKFPENAYSFAAASWRGDYNDPRELHDSWLESINIIESQDKTTSIIIKLLNSYHDRYILIEYLDVKKYFLTNDHVSHGDLLRNEIRLSENNNVIHEIEWGMDSRYVIECGDILYKNIMINC